jgi:hypothetical protein
VAQEHDVLADGGQTLNAEPTAREGGACERIGPTTEDHEEQIRFIVSKLEVGTLNPYGVRSAVEYSGVEPNAKRGGSHHGDVM